MTNNDVRLVVEKTTNRTRNFHFRYLELCRSKNYKPIAELKIKNKNVSVLDFFGDRIQIDDWLLIIASLLYDETLQNISLKLRKNLGYVLENLDTIKKVRKLKQQQQVIFSKFIFGNLINAISHDIEFNRNLNTLKLEGLPLECMYITLIAKALSKSESLKILSFNRSSIKDQGCDVICNVIKRRRNIESISMSQCQFTGVAGGYIADMIKFQQIFRYSEAWQNTLRYKNVDPDTIPGLRVIIISQNGIGDNGTEAITEILKEDVWIKEIDLSECGLTNVGAKFIIDCLEINKYIMDFRIQKNKEISTPLLKAIHEQLGNTYNEEIKNSNENQFNISKIKERIEMLEEQISLEKNLRKQNENLNEELYKKIKYYECKLQEDPEVPEGYMLIKSEDWESIIKERDEYKNAVIKLNLKKAYNFNKVRKARSEMKYKEALQFPNFNNSYSEHIFKHNAKVPTTNNLMRKYIEKEMGDTITTPIARQQTQQEMQLQNQNLFTIINNKIIEKNHSNNVNQHCVSVACNNKNTQIYTQNVPAFGGIEEAKKLFFQKKKNQKSKPSGIVTLL